MIKQKHIAIYPRVSTKYKDQTPETQLQALREYVRGRGWQIVAEHVDEAAATNTRDGMAWRDMMANVCKGSIDLVLVTKLDRTFRSAKDTYDSLAYLDQTESGSSPLPGRLIPAPAPGSCFSGF